MKFFNALLTTISLIISCSVYAAEVTDTNDKTTNPEATAAQTCSTGCNSHATSCERQADSKTTSASRASGALGNTAAPASGGQTRENK